MADVTAETGTLSDRYHFLVRRLHSLSGIIPIGVFLCIHLSVNASIISGPRAFQFAVDQIHKLNNLGILKAVEVVFIFMPIAFHAIVGVMIWLTGHSNAMAYQHGDNIRYTLQRWTGIIAILFIVTHLWHVHWIIPGGASFDPHAAAQTTVMAMSAAWTVPVYAVGLLCAVFHFANGIWTFLITWGITVGPRSQIFSARFCAIIGVVLGLLGLGALIKLKTMDASRPTPPAVQESHTAGLNDMTDLLS